MYRVPVTARILTGPKHQAAAWDAIGEMYLPLGRAEEAAAFRCQAVAVFRSKGDQWSQALALAGLATALTRTGALDEAREHRSEALGLLESFPGPAARAPRSEIEAQVGSSGGVDAPEVPPE